MLLKKILIITDKIEYFRMFEEQSKKLFSNIALLHATSYKQGVKYILENKDSIDIVITDLIFEDSSSSSILRYSISKNLPTISLVNHCEDIYSSKIIEHDCFIDCINIESKNSINTVLKLIEQLFKNMEKTVLLVDDSNTQLEFLKKILNSLRLNVIISKNGKEALKIFDNNPNISLVITDYIMPNMNGIELTKELRKKFDNDELGILALSSSEENSTAVNFIKAGADDYIIKPFGKELVKTRVSSILHRLDLFNESKIREKKIQDYVDLIDKNIITSTTDLHGDIVYVSDAFCKISGYSKEELIGQNHRIVKHEDVKKQTYKDLWDTLTLNKTWKGELKNKKKNGQFYWVKASISPIFDEFNNKIGYTAIRQDITDKKIIEEISITDGLTNIYNRRYFNEVFPKQINIAKRHNYLLSFLIIDIDYFKQYNDTYGHQKGDEVLVNVALCIKKSMNRANDYCFRIGGEEFGVIFESLSIIKAKEFSNNIRKSVENLKIEHKNNSVSSFITVSMGLICQDSNTIESHDKMYKQADELLYKAKQSGRNKLISN